jgi:hypothetical protein
VEGGKFKKGVFIPGGRTSPFSSLGGAAILLASADPVRESKIGIREKEIERDQNDGEGVESYQIQSRGEESTKQPRGRDEPSSSGVK